MAKPIICKTCGEMIDAHDESHWVKDLHFINSLRSHPIDTVPTTNNQFIEQTASVWFLPPITDADDTDHFPGCHKVHIECANKKIEEAKELITDLRSLAFTHAMQTHSKVSENDGDRCNEWLESLGGEE